ncbi:MAG: hypothetical protein KAH32_02150 [Chlamydiia bacterium]|nr:hypothetical protein [Chlamydiia bacterium]
MLFITDRASREELKAGHCLVFDDMLDEQKLSALNNLEYHKVFSILVSEGIFDISLPSNINSIVTGDIFGKSFGSLICNIMQETCVLMLSMSLLCKTRSNEEIECRPFEDLKVVNFIPVQGIELALFINASDKTIEIQSTPVKPGAFAFLVAHRATIMQESFENEEFRSVHMILFGKMNAVVNFRKQDNLVNIRELRDLYNFQDMDDGDRLKDIKVPMFKDFGLKNA